MDLGTMLSAMDNNFSSGRSQKKDRDQKENWFGIDHKTLFPGGIQKTTKKNNCSQVL